MRFPQDAQLDSTRAVDHLDILKNQVYYDGYVHDSDLTSLYGANWMNHVAENGQRLYPYVPGRSGSAGVDTLGLLQGALSMTSFGTSVPGKLGEAAEDSQSFAEEMSWSEWDHAVAGFAAYDLYRASVPVARREDLRPGDILVYEREDGWMHTGIVVQVPVDSDQPLNEWMRGVAVVSIREGFGMASLGLWGNTEGSFGGFAQESGVYHARRLLVEDPEAPRALAYTDPLDSSIRSINVAFDFTQQDRYIPNTGAVLPLDGLELQLTGTDGRAVDPQTYAGRELVFLPPIDPHYDRQDDNDGYTTNIYRNTGHGIQLVAKDREGTVYLVATATRIPSYSGSEAEAIPYTVTQDLPLVLTDTGDLAALHNGTALTELGIRAAEGAIHPGDDFRLGFGLVDHREPADPDTEQNLIVSGYTSTEDFLAVYDRKALWRANLYIDEGAADWNNQNPWNDDDNDWLTEIPHAYRSAMWEEGGQAILYSGFSSIRRTGRNDRVAYDYPLADNDTPVGAADTPWQFLDKMSSQRRAMQHVYAPLEITEATFGENVPADIAAALAHFDNWDETTTRAPADNWLNYLPWDAWEEAVRQGIDTDTWAAFGGNVPYLPGLGLVRVSYVNNMVMEEDQRDAMEAVINNEPLSLLTAGVDCIGFVQRVFDYEGNPYRWHGINDNGTGRAYPRTEADSQLGDWQTYSELIVSRETPDAEKLFKYDLIRPGDIMYTRNADGSGRHIAIVQRVDFMPNGSVNPTGVQLIEAFYDGSNAYVVGPGLVGVSRNLSDINGTWRIVRLIKE